MAINTPFRNSQAQSNKEKKGHQINTTLIVYQISLRKDPRMKGGVVAVVAILAVFQLVLQPGHAVTCGQVDAALVPCVGYLIGREDSLSPACCAGVKAVKGIAQTTADKRACCGCVKAAANRYADLKDAAAQNLPTKCGVQLDIPISRSVDCDKI